MYTNGNKILSQLIFTVFYIDTGNFKALLACKTETKIIFNTNLCTKINRYEHHPPSLYHSTTQHLIRFMLTNNKEYDSEEYFHFRKNFPL